MKHIRLIKADFDTLDSGATEFIEQYRNNKDCPIARALKRKGFKYVNVGQRSVGFYKGADRYKLVINAGPFVLSVCADKLRGGNSYAIVRACRLREC